MQTDSLPPSPEQLALLDSVIRRISGFRRLNPEDAKDFRQAVHLRLAERHYDVFDRFSGRSSLQTYLFVVVRRMLLDWQNHVFGKWRPSVAAIRLGPLAVRLERLIDRDGYSADQAIEQLRSCQAELDPSDLRGLAIGLPVRRRRQIVATELSAMNQTVDFDDPVEQRHRSCEAALQQAALVRALAGLAGEDRQLIELRYTRQLTVREVARHLRAEPKALYRRFDRILTVLRARLVEHGMTSPIAVDIR
jgi:RNA polymerase sigma factor (sigma-70 family)